MLASALMTNCYALGIPQFRSGGVKKREIESALEEALDARHRVVWTTVHVQKGIYHNSQINLIEIATLEINSKRNCKTDVLEDIATCISGHLENRLLES